MQRQFLVISEDGKVRESLATAIRRRGCTVTLAANVQEAANVIRNVAVDVALLDTRKVDARVKRQRTMLAKLRPSCRVILLTSFGSIRNSTDLLQFGLDDYLMSDVQIIDLLQSRPPSPKAGTDEVNAKGIQALTEVIEVLVGLVEMGDGFFSGTSHRVSKLARAVCEEMGVEQETMEEVLIATLLRDIGKVGVDGSVLASTDRFDDEQISRMQEHITGSTRLLEHIDFPWKIIPVIRHHHERYDGKGYPDGLKGREIPIGARIVAVVDAYVAMTSERPHRPLKGQVAAIDELEQLAGKQFDPEVVEILLRLLEQSPGLSGAEKTVRILLFDPDPIFRRHLQMRLQNSGLEVVVFEDGDRLLAEAGKSTPNLVLASVSSEHGEAFDLLREMRQNPNMAQTPFALLADENDRVMRLRALRHGVDDFMSKSDDLEELVARIENILTREATRRGAVRARRRRGITGQIENLGLPDIVQTLSIGMKTARVELVCDGKVGQIWFRDGTIVHARTGDLSGEEAFFEMVRWMDGEFAIEHGVRTRSTTIENDPMFLIMEGMRLIDEEGGENCETA